MAIVALVTQKTHSNSSDNFSKTIEFAVLHCANVTGNNNKFYCLEIQEDPTSQIYRLFSHYGRLGSSNIYEIRETDKDGDDLTEERCKKEFDKIIKKKERGKNVKRGDETIREYYSRVDVVSPSVGSENICNASEVVTSSNAPMINTSNHDTESGRLIRSMVTENIHNITSNTTMTFTSQGFETPLGPVTESHLDKATEALDSLRDELNGGDALDDEDSDVKDANSQYFSLIPRKMSHIICESDLILTPDDIAAEYDLLDNLRTAVQVGLSTDSDVEEKMLIDISRLALDDRDYRRLVDKFETTKHRNHSAIQGYRVKNIFNMDIPSVTKCYTPIAEKLGNIQELFHGTKTANMLSISLKGLIIPDTGAAHVTGRMFGNGVYGASCSTKALNYAVGYWGGGRNRGQQAYVLIVNFAMGKEYVARSHLYSGAPNGYDSIWAKAGQSLLNDEFVVYNLNQATITHILELENR
ncbi:hypothetical protein LCGC14_1325690 [marine sediment metagenome]|uniref:NAD(+) ADP-ribosyltransferase n=1 Tax=marine sediment metagenome TaxID=412755 RepID=A0A0F9KIC3_9ZZZZ